MGHYTRDCRAIKVRPRTNDGAIEIGRFPLGSTAEIDPATGELCVYGPAAAAVIDGAKGPMTTAKYAAMLLKRRLGR